MLQRRSFSSWYALGIFLCTTLLAFVDRQLLTLASVPIRQSLALSDLQLGVLQGLAFGLLAAAVSFPIAWLADRYDKRVLLAGGILLCSLSALLCGLAWNYPTLLIAAAGLAIGQAGLSPIIWSSIPVLFDDRQRATANMIYFTASLLGMAIGMALAGQILKWSVDYSLPTGAMFADMRGWRVAFVIAALPGPLVMLALATLRFPRATGVAANGASIAVAPAIDFSSFARSNMLTLGTIMGAMMTYNIALNSSLVWAPIGIPRVFHADLASIGSHMGLALGSGSVGGLTIAWLARRFRTGNAAVLPFEVATWAFALAAGPTLLMPFVNAAWQVYTIIGLQLAAGIAAASMIPNVLQDIAPPNLRTRVFTLLTIATGLAQAVGPLIIGALSGAIEGPRGLFTAIGAVGLPAWLIASILMFRARPAYLATVSRIGRSDLASARPLD